MARFPHNGLAAMPLNPGCKIARAFNIKNYPSTWISRQHICSKQHQLAVGINNAAILGYHPDPIPIAVERQPDLRVGGF